MEEEQKSQSRPYGAFRWFSLISFLTIKWVLLFVVFGGLLAGGAVAGYVAANVKDEEIRPQSYIQSKIEEYSMTGYVYFNDGTLVGQLRTDEDRIVITYDEIPQSVLDALTATEDQNFWEHPGVDAYGLGRAVKERLFNEDTQTGGSTLTQQLARRVFLSLDRTESRKIKEIFLSLRMERYLKKEEIITAYLNKMPFGNGSNGYQVFGIKAAAKGIFGIEDLNKLNIAQAAYLAGLPQLPSRYTAFTGTGQYNEQGIENAIKRQKLVLSRMRETNKITEAEYNEALAFDIRSSITEPTEKAYNTYPYLMLEAEREAAKILLLQNNKDLTLADLNKDENSYLVEDAREMLLRGGYHVHTTIDKEVYYMMHEIGSNPDNFTPDHPEKGIEQVGAILVDHSTGAILGMLEGRDFYKEQLNHATQMIRQPGSTMKTLAAYLPALEKGLIQPASIIDDAPLILEDGQKGYHIPMNANRRFAGLVTARTALNRSLNIPALKIYNEELTIPVALDFIKELGITTLTESDYYAKTGVIGGLERGVTVEEMTNAYGSIPNKGQINKSYMISKITDANGKAIYEHELKPKRVFSEQTAFLMSDMLRTTIADGAGTGAALRGQLKAYNTIDFAGKTGSTQSYGDVWFVGFTPDVTLGVWAGYEKQIHTLSNNARTRARTIWATIMNELTENRPDLFENKKFEQPENIVKATVSSTSGLLPSSLNKSAGLVVTDWFNKEYLPKKTDDSLINMKVIEYNGVNYKPNELTPEDMLVEKQVIVRKAPLDQLMLDLQAAQSKLPASSRRDLSTYVPADAGRDAPSVVDPREDDGAIPAYPPNVRLSSDFVLTFSNSSSTDVVGYRIFRSVNGGPYEKYGDSIVWTKESYAVNVNVNPAQHTSFYVVAVDVVGKQSEPSLKVEYGSNIQPPDLELPEFPNDTDLDSGNVEGNSNGNGNNGNSNNGNGGNSGNNQPALSAPSAPVGLYGEYVGMNLLLSWSTNSVSEQVTEYNVYYSADNDGNYTKLGSTSSASYEHSGAQSGGAYVITAVNEQGESGHSAKLVAQ